MVPNTPLTRLLQSGRLPLSSALYLAREIARLVLHQNQRGQSAAVTTDSLGVTRDGKVVLRNAVAQLDAVSDVKLAGTVTYQLLTGHLPAGDFAAPSHFNPGVDEELDAVVMRCLAPKAQRATSVRVLAEALDGVFEELEIEGSPDELLKLIASIPAEVVLRRTPPRAWGDETFVDDDSGEFSTVYQVPLWQQVDAFKARLGEHKKAVVAAAVAVLLVGGWALSPSSSTSTARDARFEKPAAAEVAVAKPTERPAPVEKLSATTRISPVKVVAQREKKKLTTSRR